LALQSRSTGAVHPPFLDIAASALVLVGESSYGIRSVPAVVIDGALADCCAGRGPDEKQLRAAGIGTPL
jgi:hypothetical protein